MNRGSVPYPFINKNTKSTEIQKKEIRLRFLEKKANDG